MFMRRTKDQVNFFNNLLSILQNENLDSVDDIILGGDLNCPLDPLLDKKGGASTKRKSVISCIDDTWISGDLKILTQKVLRGVKNLRQFFVVSITG